MIDSVLLAASEGRDLSDYLIPILFWGFAVAALVWLVIWLFLLGDDDASLSAESAQTEASSTSPATSPKAAPAEKVETATTLDDEEAEVAAAIAESGFVAASEDEAAKTFSGELDSGLVSQDPTYGIVYGSAPDDPDDLKRIKGVAKVLEGRLNSVGVYKFKQVAVWTEAACLEFRKLLPSFKDRIYRDNWIAQAKELHEEKYGESV
ncbi:MAG: hypothetical protein AAF236_12980 [Verrucomicrobiota bacterium]